MKKWGENLKKRGGCDGNILFFGLLLGVFMSLVTARSSHGLRLMCFRKKINDISHFTCFCLWFRPGGQRLADHSIEFRLINTRSTC